MEDFRWKFESARVVRLHEVLFRDFMFAGKLLFDIDEATNKLKLKNSGHTPALIEATKASRDADRISNLSQTEAAGAWVHNDGPECTLLVKYDSDALYLISRGDRVKTKVLSFISVVPQMIGKKLSDVEGQCSIFFADEYDPVTGGWNLVQATHVFEQDDLGKGIWLYAENKNNRDSPTCDLGFNYA
ncbi:hypothetical protein HYU18_02915 [Candidatus Woesearchaeota archaeon]|nr:hypothetical protein [Candidatus Woesearchaeota archaeon]